MSGAAGGVGSDTDKDRPFRPYTILGRGLSSPGVGLIAGWKLVFTSSSISPPGRRLHSQKFGSPSAQPVPASLARTG